MDKLLKPLSKLNQVNRLKPDKLYLPSFRLELSPAHSLDKQQVSQPKLELNLVHRQLPSPLLNRLFPRKMLIKRVMVLKNQERNQQLQRYKYKNSGLILLEHPNRGFVQGQRCIYCWCQHQEGNYG
jgi:hypothetical protein